MTDRLAIEFISVMGMPPVAFVRLAEELGVRHIGIAPQPILQKNPCGFPAWSLRDDAALRRETIAALRSSGVSVSVGEGFLAWPGQDLDAAAELDLMAELGAPLVNMISLDPDPVRSIDQCTRFAEQADARGLRAVTEFLPGMAIGTLAATLDAVDRIGPVRFGALVDTMHFFRSGSAVADIATADPAKIAYIQLCDVPVVSRHEDYGYEAQYDRLAPGDGELPLREFLAAAPRDPVIGLEIPRLAEAEAGKQPKEWIAPALDTTRRWLAEIDALA